MSKNHNNGASDTDGADAGNPGQPGAPSQHEGVSPASREKAVTRRERALIEDEAAVAVREKSVTQKNESVTLREDAADSRENTAYHREKTASSREQVLHDADRGRMSRKDTVKQRETAADSREDSIYHRESTATLREQVSRTMNVAQIASDHHLIMVRRANSQLVISAIDSQKQTEQAEKAKNKLHHLAHHDALTGLPNRTLLQDRLNQAIEAARRQGRRFAVLFMDLDRFKQINDSLGHAIGDQLLQSVSQCLRDCIRHSDTISRHGGDEFVVLLAHITQAEDAALIAQNMLKALMAPHRIDQNEIHVSASIGIGIYPDDGEDAEALLKSADSAMYYAKENGRNNYKFFGQEMNVRAVQRHSVEACLRLGLERREFLLHYQPRINLHSKQIVGAEALIRWKHPEWGLVPSSQFVSIAEDIGLILPIDRWVLRETCRQARVWQEAGLHPIVVSVNISALQLNAPDFLESVRATLEETKLEPKYLEMEFTEQVIIRNAEFTDSVLEELANLGIKLTIDDFGIGYSRLNFLRRSSIRALKIDQSFVKRMITSADNAAIVSTVISMGKNLDLHIIAAGVETAEQYASLLANQCDEGQGYFFGRPMEAEAFAAMLQPGALPLLHI
ncbi:MAG: EAL domain-containing protein [Nitrosospira sp.]